MLITPEKRDLERLIICGRVRSVLWSRIVVEEVVESSGLSEGRKALRDGGVTPTQSGTVPK